MADSPGGPREPEASLVSPGDSNPTETMVYPTLLATIGDVAHPAWRARAVGVYRLWRDGGFAVGALLAGITADLWGLRAAIGIVAAITAISGIIVAVRMYETHTHAPRTDQSDAGIQR